MTINPSNVVSIRQRRRRRRRRRRRKKKRVRGNRQVEGRPT